MARSDESNAASSPARARTWWIVGAIAVIVIIVVIVVIALTAGGRGEGLAAGTASPSPSITTPPPLQPTPSPGETGQSPAPSATPVPVTATSTPVAGVEVHLSPLEAVNGKASGVGEVSGPAIRITVNVTNSTPDPVSLSTAVVQLYYGAAQTPGLSVSGPGGSALPTSVAPGTTAQGVYLFTVPDDQRDQISITFDYRAGTPVVVFQGAGPK